MTDTWTLFDAGLWTVFAAWAFAIHLCQDPGRGSSSGE